jgi:hypothetical protein
MVMNHGKGYRLFLEDGGSIRFRVTATRGSHLKGERRGSPDHFDQLRTAFNDDEWRVGTAEVVHKHDSGDSTLPSHTRRIELPAKSMQIRLLAWM